MVRQAFKRLSDLPTRLFCFSDDMDGLRKVPDNIPDPEMLRRHLGQPLTRIPDPFGKFESFGHHNNAMLRRFLDGFGFDYEFESSTDWYMSGRFDQALLRRARPLRRDHGGHAAEPARGAPAELQPLPADLAQERPRAAGADPGGEARCRAPSSSATRTSTLTEVPVTGGHCKLQWKPDWAMRWHALGVDYEMSGKDLITSVELANKICRVLGSPPPEGFNYELFLDDKGQKISKSKGNGLSVDEWLAYAPPESLALFMYQKPRAAKRLYFDVIPRAVDDYLTFLDKYPAETPAQRLENPVWHIHDGKPPVGGLPLGFGILLNLASVAHAQDKAALWGYISRYVPDATPENQPLLDRLVGHALAYYRDFVKPAKRYRAPSELERQALADLRAELAALPAGAKPDEIQDRVYEVGKRHAFPELKAWFAALYEVLIGQATGPRMGSFIALYGIPETIALIDKALAGEDLSAA